MGVVMSRQVRSSSGPGDNLKRADDVSSHLVSSSLAAWSLFRANKDSEANKIYPDIQRYPILCAAPTPLLVCG